MTDTSGITLKMGDVLNDKWVILEFIDGGGMGEVYRAHQTNLNRDVAIKIISRKWLESIDDDDREAETAVQRFKREVQSMAQIRHPNVIQVFDHDSINIKLNGLEKPVEYIAMEYIPGGSLRDTMSEEGFYPDTGALNDWFKNYFLPVLSGVQALHDSGIIHRDLKPENIFIDHGTPKIADFGLSRSHKLKPITESIDVKGSPHYMSPEHFFDFKRADQLSDVYSLGKILFETIDGKLTTGTTPFKSVNLKVAESSYFERLDRIIKEATTENRLTRTKSVTALHEKIVELLNDGNSAKRSQTEAKTFFARYLFNPKWLLAGVITAVLSFSIMIIWHLIGNANMPVANQLQNQEIHFSNNGEDSSSNVATTSETLEHNGRQHLISQGKLELPRELEGVSGNIVEVASFYMDEFLITNQQFVNFLNHNLSRINLETGVVKGDGAIWYLLGEVHEGYEPIVYRNKAFHVSDSLYDINPVLRATGYGAAAFASFFNRRLPTEAEWLYATINGSLSNQSNLKETNNNSVTTGMADMMNNMMGNE